MDDFTGKVVLVTGAGQACGRAVAVDFGRRGACVVVDDIDDDNGRQTVSQITDAGGEATYVHADVSREDEVAPTSTPWPSWPPTSTTACSSASSNRPTSRSMR